MTRATALLVLFFAFNFAGVPAAAQVDANKTEAAKAAAARFMTLAKGSETSGKPPRAVDPTVKALLDAIYDTRDIDPAKNISFQAVQPLSQRMATGTHVALTYMLAGTGLTDLAQAEANTNVGERVNLNTIEFAPEMGRFFDFQMKVQGAIVDGVLVRLAGAKPDELKRMEAGIEQVRAGTQRTAAGLIETLAINGFTEEWRRERMPVLVSVAPKLAKFLHKQQKDQLRQLALDCAAVMDDEQVKKALENFARRIVGA